MGYGEQGAGAVDSVDSSVGSCGPRSALVQWLAYQQAHLENVLWVDWRFKPFFGSDVEMMSTCIFC